MNFEVVFFYVGEEVFLGDLEKVGVENVDGDVEFFCYFFVYLVDVFVDYLEFEVVLVNKFWQGFGEICWNFYFGVVFEIIFVVFFEVFKGVVV